MFESGILLLLQNLFINIFIPLLSGILFIWIVFGYKFKGILLYILSFFIGIGIIAAGLFNLQFIHFGVGIIEYIIINIILFVILYFKLSFNNDNIKLYINTLKLSFDIDNIKKSYLKLSLSKKIFSILSLFFISWFSLTALLFNTNFPTYADDSFGNWNTAVINIYNDGGVKLIGDKTEILGKGRLGYPIYMSTYKALIASFNGGINDIYINFLQYLLFILFLLFIFYITFKKTNNIYYSLIPLVLISGLPLVFFHSVEGYMELPSAIYSVLTIYFLYLYLENKKYNYLVLGLLFSFFLINIKNEGLVVYLSGIIFSFFTILLIKKNLLSFFKGIIDNKKTLYKIIGLFSFISLPFLILRLVYGIGLNPVQSDSTGITIHSEIFNYFPAIFLGEDNYNISLIFIAIFTILFLVEYFNKGKINNLFFTYTSFVYIFIIFTLVFLLTDNYKWVINQTTVNRVFTMSFIILFSFSGFYLNEFKKK